MKRNIVVGITGGIAAYKAAEIINDLVKKGYEVNVIMTKNATEFITPLTLQTLSNNKVAVEQFDHIDKWDTEHIALAKKADLFLIVPATANFLAKLAHGIADDMLTTTVMATKAKVLIAPAMNSGMWENPIVQSNVSILKKYGYMVLDTASGRLACGDNGSGKLLDWKEISRLAQEQLKE